MNVNQNKVRTPKELEVTIEMELTVQLNNHTKDCVLPDCSNNYFCVSIDVYLRKLQHQVLNYDWHLSRHRIDRKVGLILTIFVQFLDVLHWHLDDVWFYKGGKCRYFALINK